MVGSWDERIEGYVVKVAGPWLVSIHSLMFNDRVCLTHLPTEYPVGWTSAWCYDKGGTALHAATLWDPLTDQAPAGYKKVAADGR